MGAFPAAGSSGRRLTLIMALEVMRKSVARSLTCLILSVLSGGSRRASSSLRERCRAVPCLAIRSLQVLRSSTLLDKIRRVFCSSVLSVCDTDSSPESSAGGKARRVWDCCVAPGAGDGAAREGTGDPQIPEGSQTLMVHLCARQAFGVTRTDTAIPFQTFLLEMLGCCPGHWDPALGALGL